MFLFFIFFACVNGLDGSGEFGLQGSKLKRAVYFTLSITLVNVSKAG